MIVTLILIGNIFIISQECVKEIIVINPEHPIRTTDEDTLLSIIVCYNAILYEQ